MPRGRISRLYYHAWQDLFMGSRLPEYRNLLRYLGDAGYEFRTLSEFVLATDRGESIERPVCLLRNDIDSDPAGAARMFACDRDEGVRATYFFRLSTLDPALARRIVDHGGEVGYHFEEIATVAGRLGLQSRQQIDAHMELIRDEFRSNVHRFHARTGIYPRIVAAHGDFINRRLGIPNQYLLNRSLLSELGIVADAYDERIHANLKARFSDWPAPQWWNPQDPMIALHGTPASVSILVHPRQWVCNPLLNVRLAVTRLSKETAWRSRSVLTKARAVRSSRPAPS
jgi:hypothetical protein